MKTKYELLGMAKILLIFGLVGFVTAVTIATGSGNLVLDAFTDIVESDPITIGNMIFGADTISNSGAPIDILPNGATQNQRIEFIKSSSENYTGFNLFADDTANEETYVRQYITESAYPDMFMIQNFKTTGQIALFPNRDLVNYFIFDGVADAFYGSVTNAIDLGTTALRFKNGYIVNAWTVGDLVFNFGAINGSGGTDYRIIEAEKLTNNKSQGLMYVMDGKAVLWIEPSGKLHTTQEIDMSWKGIDDLSFDEDGGIYKNNEVVRYPVIGEGNNSMLPEKFIDAKDEFNGDGDISKLKKKPLKYEKAMTSTTLIS